jgi:LEA14-like dessication related protein
LLLAFSFTSCLTTKSIEYKRIEHVEVKGDLSPVIRFDLVLANPNNWGIRLTELKSDVLLENRTVGQIALPSPIRIKRKSEVSIPIHVELSTMQLFQLLPTGLGLLSDKKPINTGIKGDLTIRKFLFKRTFPFQYSQKVSTQ